MAIETHNNLLFQSQPGSTIPKLVNAAPVRYEQQEKHRNKLFDNFFNKISSCKDGIDEKETKFVEKLLQQDRLI